MKRSLFAALVSVAALLAACNSGTQQGKYDQNQTQVAITPKGTIIGRITEMGTATALDGVKVTLLSPGVQPATTDASGVFTFTDVVVTSQLELLLSKDGYVPQRTYAMVPGSVANYYGGAPLQGGIATVDAALAKADGSVKGMVFLPNNRPAVNATVSVDQRRSSLNGGGSTIGDSVVSVKTGMDGSFELTGLGTAPEGVNHRVVAQWFDENADGQADFSAQLVNVDVYPSGSSRIFITYSDIGQRVIDSNIFDGEIAAADTIDLTFAMPVLSSGQNGEIVNQFVLTNLTRGGVVAIDQQWASPLKVSLKPQGGNLREGDQYRVAMNLKQTNGNGYNASFTFQVRAATVTPPSKQVANFSVTNPNRTPSSQFDYNDNVFTLAFDTIPGIGAYQLYAKDTTNNQAYVYITRVTPAPGTGRLTFNIALPAIFNNGRPLSEGNKVTFTAVPIDGYGNVASLASSPVATIGDNLPPRAVGSPVGIGTPDGINEGTAVTTLQMRLTYSEPMDATAAPVYTYAGGAVTQTFVWEAPGTTGILTLSVPTGGDITGPFTIRGGKDMAGNTLATADFSGVLGGRREYLNNGGFEDNTGCVLTGWNATGTPAPTAVPSNNSTTPGRCGALLGSATGSSPFTGLVKLQQDVVLPNFTNDLGWYYDYRLDYRTEYQTTGNAAAVTQRCRITDTSDVTLVSLFNLSSTNTGTFSSASGNGLTPGTTVRVQCEVNNATTDAANAAVFIDNISVALVKPGTI